MRMKNYGVWDPARQHLVNNGTFETRKEAEYRATKLIERDYPPIGQYEAPTDDSYLYVWKGSGYPEGLQVVRVVTTVKAEPVKAVNVVMTKLD